MCVYVYIVAMVSMYNIVCKFRYNAISVSGCVCAPMRYAHVQASGTAIGVNNVEATRVVVRLARSWLFSSEL